MSGFKVTRKEDKEDNSWVETYADAITLLMAFFVVLLSMSTMNKKKYEYMVEVIHKGMNQSVVTIEAPTEQDGKTEEIRSFVKQPVPALSEMSYLNTLADVTYDITHDGATLTFPDTVLFVPNSARLRDDARPKIASTIEHLKDVDPYYFDIIIEAHINKDFRFSRKAYRSKWEFTAARSIALREALEQGGIDEKILSVVSYADIRPVEKPDPTAGPEVNRRMVIRIKQKL
ncbi:MAG: hypothetical protein CMK59_04290 [Proteobacteria bacterium]|nr:hypothetical protein [Pseudomonadota bacterium]